MKRWRRGKVTVWKLTFILRRWASGRLPDERLRVSHAFQGHHSACVGGQIREEPGDKGSVRGTAASPGKRWCGLNQGQS